MDATGAPGVHLIGHSLGGLVVREAVQRRGVAAYTRAAVTIATPHAGTWVARFAPGPCARQMRPGSPFLTELGCAMNEEGEVDLSGCGAVQMMKVLWPFGVAPAGGDVNPPEAALAEDRRGER